MKNIKKTTCALMASAMMLSMTGCSFLPSKNDPDDVIEAERIMNDEYDKWEQEDMLRFIDKILESAKPIIIVANKIDTPQAEENIKRQ